MALSPASADEVERIARAVLGSREVLGVEPQHGYGNQTWRVVDETGRAFVLKLGDLASAAKWRSAHRALDLAACEGVPVPELVHDERHGDRLVRVFSWIDGVIAKTADLDEAQETRFVASLGRAVAALHRVRLEAFSSRLDGSSPSFARWTDYLARRFHEIRGRCEATGAVAPAVIDRAASVLDRLSAAIEGVAEPVLCHRDLHAGNLILGADGTVCGIIDWDMAEPWDRAGDWFKLEYEVLRARPQRADDLLDAYLAGGPVPERWGERRAAVHLVETLNILPNVVAQGWSDEYADRARRHLDELIAEHG